MKVVRVTSSTKERRYFRHPYIGSYTGHRSEISSQLCGDQSRYPADASTCPNQPFLRSFGRTMRIWSNSYGPASTSRLVPDGLEPPEHTPLSFQLNHLEVRHRP